MSSSSPLETLPYEKVRCRILRNAIPKRQQKYAACVGGAEGVGGGGTVASASVIQFLNHRRVVVALVVVVVVVLFAAITKPATQQPGTNEFVCKPQSLHVPCYNGNDLA